MLLKNLWDILKETREKNILQILHTGIWLLKKNLKSINSEHFLAKISVKGPLVSRMSSCKD